MKIKLQFLGIILILGLTVHQLDKNLVPNQQIIIEFTDSNYENESKVLTRFKKDLKHLGVSNLSIKKLNSGVLLFTYYSNVKITTVQKVINTSVNNNLYISNNNPHQQHPENQKVTFKIQHLDEDGLPIKGLSDHAIVETSVKANRLDTKLNDFQCSGFIHTKNFFLNYKSLQNNNCKDLSYTFQLNYNLPEVRAGPYCIIG